MKILVNGLIVTSTITARNESQNYPVTNLQHQFLHRRFQSSLDTDLATIMLEEISDISCVFYGWTNATRLIYRFYGEYDTLLFTLDITDPQAIGAHYFNTVEDVVYVTIELFGSDIGVYLGGTDFGICIDWPIPRGDWPEMLVDNSITSSSPDGQTLQNYIEPLDGFTFGFVDNDRSEMNNLKDIYKLIGKGLPIWIDPFENNHNFLPPMYAQITSFGPAQKNGVMYDFEMTILEAR